VVGSEADVEAVRSTTSDNAFDGATVRWSRATSLEMDNVFERRAEPSDLGVRVWIDLSDGRKASFYFADRAGEHFLVRSMALPDALTPLALEAIGQVLELSVRALLEDARVGMSRAEIDELLAHETRAPEKQSPAPPEAAEAPEAATAAPDRSSLGAEAFYGARLFSSEVSLVHGPGLGLAWITESAERRTAFWVKGQYDLPQELVTPEVSVEWTTVRVEGGLGLDINFAASSFFAGGRLGAGAEFTSFSPRAGSANEALELAPSSVSTVPVVSLALEAGLPLGDRLAASARLFASVYPIRVHFDLAEADGQKEVLVPYWVRPGIELCLELR